MATDKARHAGRTIGDQKRKMKTGGSRKVDTAGRSAVHDKPADRRSGTGDQLTAL